MVVRCVVVCIGLYLGLSWGWGFVISFISLLFRDVGVWEVFQDFGFQSVWLRLGRVCGGVWGEQGERRQAFLGFFQWVGRLQVVRVGEEFFISLVGLSMRYVFYRWGFWSFVVVGEFTRRIVFFFGVRFFQQFFAVRVSMCGVGGQDAYLGRFRGCRSVEGFRGVFVENSGGGYGRSLWLGIWEYDRGIFQ